MTVALLGIVVTIGVQRVDISVWRLDSAAQAVVQRVRAARALAILRQHDVIVNFDINRATIVVHEDVNNDGQIGADERVRRYALESGMEFSIGAAPPYAGYAGGAVTFAGQAVTFHRNGSASQEGAVYVSKAGVRGARVVVIGRATGSADVHRFNGARWSAD